MDPIAPTESRPAWTTLRMALAVLLPCALLLAACSKARLPLRETSGPEPVVAEARDELIPTIDIAPARGWPEGAKPVAAAGLRVHAYASGFEHPRWLHVLPNGDVLVAETAAPAKEDGPSGLKALAMKKAMEIAGAAVPSADRITLLRDADGDGVPELRTALIEGLHSPFGMALVGDALYVANTGEVLRFPYPEGQTRIDAPGERVASLPVGSVNQHWTRGLLADAEGRRLFVSVGSASNIGEHGMDEEEGRAAIWVVDLASGEARIYASGQRNPVGMDWHPRSGALWVVVNERDELGGDVPLDYLTAVEDGQFYGWPWSYHGRHVDERVEPQRPDMVARAATPAYSLGPHVAPLGLAFYDADLLPPRWRGGAFVALHGSWNRKPPSGYRVVFVRFAGERPTGVPEDVLTGFLSDDGDAYGRPVGLAVAADGALLVADDVGNTVWRVAAQERSTR